MPNLAGGGAERVTANLVAALVQQGCEVELVLVHGGGVNATRIPPQVQQFVLGSSRTLLAAPALAKYLRQRRPAALLAVMDTAGATALVARRLAGVATRVVIAIHSATRVQATAQVSRAERWLPRLLRPRFARADAVVAVSQGLADELVTEAPALRGRVHTIYNAVVTAELVRLAGQPSSEPWAAPGGVPLVVAVGRLCAAKDFATLLQAFAIARQSRPLHLILYGQGELLPDLTALAAQLGIAAQVQFAGFSDNPWATVRQAAVFALSSEYEALPTALIEALACGTPCVATNCRFGPAEILGGGRWGQLVAPRDAAALAAAMLTAVAQPRDSAALIERAAAFGEAACAQAYLRLLLPS